MGNKITVLRQQFLAARERTEFATVNVELVDEDNGAVGTSETDEASTTRSASSRTSSTS